MIFPDSSSSNTFYNGTESATRSTSEPLLPGDFADLGSFDAGTQLDFFLIANGANGGTNVWTGDMDYNADGMQHMVAFAIPDSPYLLIGFEDLYGGGDMDYNDILFVADIGESNVVYLSNPEPGFWLLAIMVGGYFFKRQKKFN